MSLAEHRLAPLELLLEASGWRAWVAGYKARKMCGDGIVGAVSRLPGSLHLDRGFLSFMTARGTVLVGR